MESYPQPPMGETKKTGRELNPEEIRDLFNKLSSDETKDLRDLMNNCASEITLTRGIPITSVVLGSLYFARTRLPPQYHFGPKGWPFYAIIGIGSMVVTNMFFLKTCRERMMPKVEQYWQKYQEMDSNKMTYDHIRQQHRAGLPAPAMHSAPPHETTYDTLRHEHRGQPRQYQSPPDTFIYSMPQDQSSFHSYGQPEEKDVITQPRRPYAYQPYSEEPSYMSGTPSGPR